MPSAAQFPQQAATAGTVNQTSRILHSGIEVVPPYPGYGSVLVYDVSHVHAHAHVPQKKTRSRRDCEINRRLGARARRRASARSRHGSAGPGPRASPGACALPLRSRLPLFFSPPPPQTPGPSQPAYRLITSSCMPSCITYYTETTRQHGSQMGRREKMSLSLSQSLFSPPAPSLKRQASPAPSSPPPAPWPRPCHTSNRRSHARALSSRPALPHTLSPQAPVPLSHPSLR